MTRDSDEPSKPSNILGRQARYPTQADRGGMSRNPNLAPGRGPDGSGTLRTSRDQTRNHRLPLVSVGLVSTWSRGRVGPEVHSSKGHSTSPDNHTPGRRLGYGPTRPGTRSQTQPQGVHFIPAEQPATSTIHAGRPRKQSFNLTATPTRTPAVRLPTTYRRDGEPQARAGCLSRTTGVTTLHYSTSAPSRPAINIQLSSTADVPSYDTRAPAGPGWTQTSTLIKNFK